MTANLDDRTMVLASLQKAGLSPSPEEIEAMVAAYQGVRRSVAVLYDVPGVRYEDPAIIFDPRLDR